LGDLVLSIKRTLSSAEEAVKMLRSLRGQYINLLS
jgi:hypothetical protein